MKLDFKKTFLIGLGFFGVTLVWTLYNSFVPVILEKFIASGTIIGLIMTLDNILAVTVQPIVGAVSDKTRTKIGRRMPYIIIGAPIAALFFIFIPIAKILWLLIRTIVIMNLFMALYRSPVVALMPDVIPSPLRSKANGIINFMGGFGALLVFFVGGPLFDIDPNIPFTGVAIILVFAVILLFLTIKEPKEIPHDEAEDISWKLVKVSTIAIICGIVAYFTINSLGLMAGTFENLFGAAYQGHVLIALIVFAVIVFITLFRMVERNSIFIFLAIFFWFFGYNGVETFFTLYGVNTLGLTAGKAAFILGIFSLFFIIFAIPSGYIATRVGRKKTIITGLVGMSVLMGALAFTTNITILYIIMVFGGISWAAININSIPMIWDITTEEMLGTYTGLYYFFSMLAQTVSPPIIGITKDMTGSYQTMFYVVPFFFVAALIMMLFVKKGEAKDVTTTDMMEQMEV
jgi:maltose/moltooligosaccharide transporter